MVCENDQRLEFQTEFVGYGKNLEPMPGKIALDVGNHLLPGVIDHHQSGAPEECAASLVALHPDYVLWHLEGVPIGEVTIITHVWPDLDGVTAAWLCRSLIRTGSLPPRAELIARYVRDVDQGICFRRAGAFVTVYSIFCALCQLIHKDLAPDVRGSDAEHRRRMACGFWLWDFVQSVMNDETDLHGPELFRGEHPFKAAQDLVVSDYAKYMKDLRSGTIRRYTLSRKDGSGSETVDALLVDDPKSLLFKSWARGDSLNAPGGRGFALLVIGPREGRCVISVDPQAPVHLKGLGERLEAAEKDKRKAMGLVRQGPPREGYDGPDPWYDGRGALHDYTIVDTPWSGTVLDREEIHALLAGYAKEAAGG